MRVHIKVVMLEPCAIRIQKKQPRHPAEPPIGRRREMDLLGQLIGAHMVRLKNFVEWFGTRREEVAGVGMPITRDRSQNSNRHGVVGADEAAGGFRIPPSVSSPIRY